MFGGPWNSTSTQQELASLTLDNPTVNGLVYELNFYLLGDNNSFSPCSKPGTGSCFSFGFFFYKSSDNLTWPSQSFFPQGTFPNPNVAIDGSLIIANSWNAYSLQYTADNVYDRVLVGWFPNPSAYTNQCLSPSSNNFTGYVYMDKLCIDVLGNNCPICAYQVDITALKDSICENENVSLTSTTSGGVQSINWTTNGSGTFDNSTSNNPIYQPSLADFNIGKIKLFASSDDPIGTCLATKDSIEVVLNKLDSINFSYSQSEVCLPSTNLIPVINIATNGTFSINNGGIIDSKTGEININQSGVGVYQITFNSADKCPNSKSFDFTICNTPTPEIIVEEIEIPNVFSPNDDGINDLFFIKGNTIKSCELVIFNRWGNILFKGSDIKATWNGKTKENEEISEGVYFYKISVLDFNNELKTFSGNITLTK